MGPTICGKARTQGPHHQDVCGAARLMLARIAGSPYAFGESYCCIEKVALPVTEGQCDMWLTCCAAVLQVSYIEFSPDEKYVLSYSSREPSNPSEKAALLVNVFDAQNGAKLRKFEGSIEEFAVGSAAMGDGSLKWPIFKWAASG